MAKTVGGVERNSGSLFAGSSKHVLQLLNGAEGDISAHPVPASRSLPFGLKFEPSHVRGMRAILRVRRRRRRTVVALTAAICSLGLVSSLRSCKSRVFGAALNWI